MNPNRLLVIDDEEHIREFICAVGISGERWVPTICYVFVETPKWRALAPIRRRDILDGTALLDRQPNAHANPPYLVVGTYRITKPSNQSTGIDITIIITYNQTYAHEK